MEKHAFIYRALEEVIVLTGLHYTPETYREQEINLLEPRLRAVGYVNIHWSDGERDSFGPLTRVCSATNQYGERVYFVYG
jgi:hypothetical protein